MAGAGFKTFVDGNVLTAAEVNTYLMQQSVMVFADASARSTAIAAPSEGMVTYLTGSDVLEYYDGAAWQPILDQDVIAAKGDLIVGTADDTVQALTVGSNEQRLVADSGETTGLKYVADTTNYAIGAKGDLLVGTAADTVTNLAVGTNGHVLTADSGEASGVKWAAAAGGGKVLQVVQGTHATATENSSGSWATTNLTASITPSAATSKVLVLVAQWLGCYGGATQNGAGLRLVRGATTILQPYDNFNRTIFINSTAELQSHTSLAYLDSPSTTSSTTYKTEFINATSNTARVQGGNATSTIILIEIGA